jgi:hypothetical protein
LEGRSRKGTLKWGWGGGGGGQEEEEVFEEKSINL